MAWEMSPTLILSISVLRLLGNIFSSIQPISPPSRADSDILNFKATFSKPSVFIADFISFILLSRSFLLICGIIISEIKYSTISFLS